MGPLAVAMLQVVVGLIITAVASRLMSEDGIKAKGLDDFKVPTIDSDRAIPVAFGDVLVEGPNVTWFGDYKARPNREGGNLFSPSQIIAYNYHIGMELVLCWGTVDELNEIWFGDNLAWSGSVSGAQTGTDAEGEPIYDNTIDIDEDDLFGGKGQGGGVQAIVRFYPGSIYQRPDPYMEEQIGEGYYHKGISKVVWYGPSTDEKKNSGKVGESPYVQPIKFRVQHYPNYLGSSYKKIGSGDTKGANPAEVVYALLTGRYANVNSTQPTVPVIPDNLIDTATFLAVASTLYSEGMGISFQWQRDTPVRDLINEVMHTVDGYLCEDTFTGKIRFVLNRQDYDPNTCPVFDEDNIVDFSSYVRINPSAAVNRLTANFTDPSQAFKSIPIMVEDLGNVYEQDMGAPGEIDLSMLHDVDAAITRTTRELVQLSEGIVSGAFTANREAYSLNIGDPIKITWEGFGVNELLVRVIEKTVGGLDDRKIQIKFVQDIFGIGTAIYGAPGGSTWVDIFNDPEDITQYKFLESPYWLFGRYPSVEEQYALFLMTKFPSSDTSGYELFIQVDDGGYYNGYGTNQTESDHTTLFLDYDQDNGPGKDTSGSLRIVGPPPDDASTTQSFANIDLLFKNWIQVNDEFLAYESVSNMGDGSYRLNNVYRGLIDSTPANHKAGDTVWFLNESFTVINRAFTIGEDVDIKTITSAGNGVLDDANAAVKRIVYDGRSERPMAPAAVKINDGYYPAQIVGDLIVSWAARDRLAVTTLRQWDDASVTPETGQTTTLKIYGQFNQLIKTVVDITDLTYTYTQSQELSDIGFVNDRLTIELSSVRDAISSFSTFSYTFDRSVFVSPVAINFDMDTPSAPSDSDINFNLDEIS